MPSRFTNTEKWSDPWYRQLSPNEKTLYSYMWDKCNVAGFWEIDLAGAIFNTRISKRTILGAFEGLARGYWREGNHIWIRKFLFHQKNLPLNPNNNAHIGILRQIENYKLLFPNVLKELNNQLQRRSEQAPTEPLGRAPGKGISKGIGKGKDKDKYKDCVFLTKEEYQKLIDRFGKEATDSLIEDLDAGIDSKGYRYTNHYKTLINWAKRARKSDTKKPRKSAKELEAEYAEQRAKGQSK